MRLAEREFGGKTYTWGQWSRTAEAEGEDAANAEQQAALDAGKILRERRDRGHRASTGADAPYGV